MSKEAGWYKVGGRAKYWDGSTWMAGDFDLATISEPLRNASGVSGFYESVRAQSTVADASAAARPVPSGYSTPAASASRAAVPPQRQYQGRPATAPPPPPGQSSMLPPPPPPRGPASPQPRQQTGGIPLATGNVPPEVEDVVRKVGGAGKFLRWGVIAFIAIVFGPTIIAFVMDILGSIVDSLE